MSTDIEDQQPTPSCPSSECSLPVDVVFRSSGGDLLGAHSANLSQFAAAFPPAAFVQTQQLEIVPMEETTAVLEILLQYMHHQVQPDSSTWAFSLLQAVAEAAEKYIVFSAMAVCKLQMRSHLSEHPLLVLAYATKHGYADLRNEIIPKTLSFELDEVERVLNFDPTLLIAWVKYREVHLRLIRNMSFNQPMAIKHNQKGCTLWGEFHRAVVDAVNEQILPHSLHAGKIVEIIASTRYMLCLVLPLTSMENAENLRVEQSDAPACAAEGCKTVVDVVLRSSDGKLLAAHAKNLEFFAEGFPPAALLDTNTHADSKTFEVVQMAENAAALELLLQYMHTQKLPNLANVPFSVLAQLAEAAEKYLVYSAMDACKSRMRIAAKNHPLEVLNYASKHDYTELMEEVAPMTVSMPFYRVRAALTANPMALIAWCQYRETFLELRDELLLIDVSFVLHKGGVTTCEDWAQLHGAVWNECATDKSILSKLESIPDVIQRLSDTHLDCFHCQLRAQKWVGAVNNKLSYVRHPPSFVSCFKP
uniref:BTB domain-containing protein n=1 Tax=Mycena chlorophos TaxID=658473 RepID=A0ABQ0LHS3_MYCCL|nr:predicted protein [Mycena chlorophos]